MALLKLLENSEGAASYIVREITRICQDMGRRSPGSEGERKAAEYMAHVLEDECGCTDVKVETFTEHPDSFLGYFSFTAVLGVLSAACFFISPWAGLIFAAMDLMLFILQFVLYKELIDPLCPEGKSVNVTALKPCSSQIKQRVFLNGHMDAAWEFPLNYYFGGVVFEIPGVMAVSGVVYFIGISICAILGAGDWTRIAALCGLIFVPAFILVGCTYNSSRIVDGANDNLSGCYMGIALLREMERQGICPEHTQVGVILTGSEEAGLKGAKAWSRMHKDDFRDVPTYIISFDTIHDPKQLMINRRDLNATVASDEQLCSAFLQAARNVQVPCKTGQVPLFGGSTDGAAFVQGGFRAVSVTGLSHVLEDYYHTRRDSWDNLNPQGLENCYKATVSLIDLIDSEKVMI